MAFVAVIISYGYHRLNLWTHNYCFENLKKCQNILTFTTSLILTGLKEDISITSFDFQMKCNINVTYHQAFNKNWDTARFCDIKQVFFGQAPWTLFTSRSLKIIQRFFHFQTLPHFFHLLFNSLLESSLPNWSHFQTFAMHSFHVYLRDGKSEL